MRDEAQSQQLAALSRNLRRLARHLVGDDETADDLVQEAWLVALNQEEHEVRNLNAWLRQVVRNLAGRQRRRASLRRDVERRAAQSESVSSEEELLERVSTFKHLRRAAERLREPYRTVLLQRFFEDRSVAQIASALGRPLETVRSQVRRGLAEMRVELDRRHAGKRAEWAALLVRVSVSEEERALARAAGAGAEATPGWGLVVASTLVVAVVGGLFLWRPWVPAAEGAGSALASAPPAVSALGPELRAPPERDPDPREAAAGEPEAAPGTPSGANAGTRTLDVVVLRRDGTPAERSTIFVYGRHAEPIATYEGEGAEASFVLKDGDLLGPPRIAGPDPGVAIHARADGEATSPNYNLPVPAEGRRFELRSSGPGQDLLGTVLDVFGEPAPGVMITPRTEVPGVQRNTEGVPFTEHDFVGVTDADGRFRIEGLPVRAHLLRLRGGGYVPQDIFVQEDGDEIEVRIVVTPGAVVAGEVRRPDGSPAAGAAVWQPSPDPDYAEVFNGTQADEQGGYRLAGLAPGASVNLFACDADDEELFACTVLSVPESGEASWDAVLAGDRGLRLRVVEEDESSVPQALCLLVRAAPPVWGEIRMTDAGGGVRFPHVAQGEVALAVKREVSDPSPACIVPAVERTRGEIVVTLPPRAPRTSSVRGVLLDADGRPFESAVVLGTLVSLAFDVAVDPRDGTFSAEGLNTGTYVLWALVPERGAVPLGTHELIAAELYDLGTVRAEREGSVRLDWGTARPDSDRPWVLRVELPGSGFRERDVVVLQAVASGLSLLPGTYRLGSAGSDPLSGRRFVLGPGEDVRLELAR